MKIPQDKEEYIIKNYSSKSTKEIKEYTGLSITTIMRVLKRNNIKNKTSKLYSYNYDFFENIDSEEKSYWLGFLYADGYVRKRNISSELRLKLSIKDIDHLYLFKNILKSTSPIRINNDQAVIYICGKKIVDDLINNGCFQNKSSSITFPELDKNLIRHFIRGYFDGDGSIKFTDKKNPSLNIVSGSFIFLEEIKKTISISCNIRNPKIFVSSNGNYGNIFWNSIPDIVSIYFYLYKNSNVYLNRKKQIFLKIIKYIETKEKTNRMNAWKRTKYIMEMQ